MTRAAHRDWVQLREWGTSYMCGLQMTRTARERWRTSAERLLKAMANGDSDELHAAITAHTKACADIQLPVATVRAFRGKTDKLLVLRIGQIAKVERLSRADAIDRARATLNAIESVISSDEFIGRRKKKRGRPRKNRLSSEDEAAYQSWVTGFANGIYRRHADRDKAKGLTGKQRTSLVLRRVRRYKARGGKK